MKNMILSYKQEDNIRYHARDIAAVRGQKLKNVISLYYLLLLHHLETQNNINKKKYKHVYSAKSQFSGIEST